MITFHEQQPNCFVFMQCRYSKSICFEDMKVTAGISYEHGETVIVCISKPAFSCMHIRLNHHVALAMVELIARALRKSDLD